MNCYQGTEEEGHVRGGEKMGDKVPDKRSDAEVKVAMGHPARELCFQESSWLMTEGERHKHAENDQAMNTFGESRRLTVEPEKTPAFKERLKLASSKVSPVCDPYYLVMTKMQLSMTQPGRQHLHQVIQINTTGHGVTGTSCAS